MNINRIGFNINKGTNFGLLTDNAGDTLFSSSKLSQRAENLAMQLLEDNDFIVDFDDKRNKCEMYSINYNTSCVFPVDKSKFCTNYFLEKVVSKMSEMKNRFPFLSKREEKLNLDSFN